MKRILFTFLMALLVVSPLVAQQFQTKETTFAPKEANIYHTVPVSALNSNTGQSLVVWERVVGTDHSIVGRLMNSKGVAVSGQITLAAPPATRPAIAYNSQRNEYLLAYDDNPNLRQIHTDVWVRRLNAQGGPAAAATEVTTDVVSAAMANFNARVTYNSRNATYGIVWLREILTTGQIAEGNNGLVGTVLSGTGPTPGTVSVIARTILERGAFFWPIPLDLVYHPTNGKAILGFVQVVAATGNTQANYSLGTLEPNFSNIVSTNFGRINANVLALSANFSWGLEIAFQANGNGIVIFVDTPNIKRRKINTAGKLSGPATAAFKPPKNFSKLYFPSLAFANGPSGVRGILIALENVFSNTGAAVIWAQPLKEDGLPLGVPIKLDTTAATESAVATTLLGIPQAARVPWYKFTSFYVLGTFEGTDRTFVSANIIELNSNVTFP